MAGWMKTPLGTEVDLVLGHTVLDGGPSTRERGTAAPLFSAHVYCGHGRPSRLLLSSYTNYRPKREKVKRGKDKEVNGQWDKGERGAPGSRAAVECVRL